MNSTVLFAAELVPAMPIFLAVLLMLLWIGIFVVVWAVNFRKVGPNQVLVVSGRKVIVRDADGKTHERGFRLVKGGGTFVFPVVEKAQVLSLQPFSVDLSMPRLPVRAGGSVRLQGTAQVRIPSDDLSLYHAVEALLGKPEPELKAIVRQLLESSFQETLATRSAEEVAQGESTLSSQLQETARPKLAEFGLQLVSLSVRMG